MSVRVMAAVWEREDLDPRQKFVLLSLADHADPSGERIFPSANLLARKTGYHLRSIRRIVGELLAAGHLEVVSDARGHRPNEYRIPWIGREPASAREKPRQHPSARLRAAIIARDRRRCFWCLGEGDGKNGPNGKTWHMDRLDTTLGYEEANVVLSCGPCNVSRARNRASSPTGQAVRSGPDSHDRSSSKLDRTATTPRPDSYDTPYIEKNHQGTVAPVDQRSTGATAQSQVPDSVSSLLPHLNRVGERKGAKAFNLDVVVRACEKFADRDLDLEAERFEHYWLEGMGENRPMRDVAAAWRNWLQTAPRMSKRGQIRAAERRQARDHRTTDPGKRALHERINRAREAAA